MFVSTAFAYDHYNEDNLSGNLLNRSTDPYS